MIEKGQKQKVQKGLADTAFEEIHLEHYGVLYLNRTSHTRVNTEKQMNENSELT